MQNLTRPKSTRFRPMRPPRSARLGSLMRRYSRQRLVQMGLLALIGGVILLFLFSFILFAWYSRNLPAPGKILRTSGFSTTFLDREGEVLFDMFEDKNRIPVDVDKLPDHVKEATIAIEDKDFYKHSGFSVAGIIRAALKTVLFGRVEGGSTLTQQLVKNVLLTSERTITRKIKEFVLSTAIERRYTKDQILEMYLNEAPYGGTFWGIEAAAQGYFGKEASELSLVEAAVLAGFPQRPSTYSPFVGEGDAYVGRAEDVLRRMREDDYISKDQEKEAVKKLKKIKFSAPKIAITAPHFVFWVRDQIAQEYGEKIIDQGLEITTTIDKEIQEEVEDIVAEEIEKIRSLDATNGSVVVLDSKTAEILAMVGSYDYNDEEFGRYNTATALRQPGSALKPITYAVAFEKGYTPSTVVMDVKTEFPNQGEKAYVPENYDAKFRGPVQLRFALGNSVNIAAVKLLAMVGIRDFLERAWDMGLDTLEPTKKNIERFGLSVTLGGGETRLVDLAEAYSVFARGGLHKDYWAVREIKDHRGKRIFKGEEPPEKKVLTEDVAYLVSHILSDNNARLDAFGPNSYLRIGALTVAAKTGTSNDKRDNWACGYTVAVTVCVWVGNNDNSPMNPKIASGATGASPIWNRVMRHLLRTFDDGIIQKPDNIIATHVDAYLGGMPKDGRPTRSEFFIDGTQPTDVSPYYKKLKISKNDNSRLANELEIKLGEYEERDYIVITEKDPVSTDGKNRWQEGIDAWLREQPDDKLKPPTGTSEAKSEEVVVSIKEPGDQSRVDANDFKIRARITSIDPVNKVEVKVGDNVIATYTDDRDEIEEHVNLSDGTYEITVSAENTKGKSGSARVRIGVNREWDEVTPTPTPTP